MSVHNKQLNIFMCVFPLSGMFCIKSMSYSKYKWAFDDYSWSDICFGIS